MLSLSRILCPVDLSPSSRSAFGVALALARWHQATVHVLYVIDPGPTTGSETGALFEVTPAMRASAEEALEWFVARKVDLAVGVHPVVREGATTATILNEATALAADLIVLGTHGRGGFERFALGSIAEKIVRKAMCPVLTVPPEEAGASTVMRGVLAATDFSRAAEQAVAYARFLAMVSGAALTVATVVEWPFGDTGGADPVAELRASLEAEAGSRLAATIVEGGPPTQTVVLTGKPWRELTAYARAHRIGLMVVGHAGHGALDLAFLGSTAHRILHDAPCPVLTVRPTGQPTASDG